MLLTLTLAPSPIPSPNPSSHPRPTPTLTPISYPYPYPCYPLLGGVVNSPEAARVYIGSFWDAPWQHTGMQARTS